LRLHVPNWCGCSSSRRSAGGRSCCATRFADSTTAYQGYGRGLPLELVQACNRLATDGLQPDVTVLLELPVALALQRSGRGDRMEQGALEFFERVREGYLELARQEPERILVIDAQGSPEAVHERIWRELRARFGWE
jgi:dTMP kinase